MRQELKSLQEEYDNKLKEHDERHKEMEFLIK